MIQNNVLITAILYRGYLHDNLYVARRYRTVGCRAEAGDIGQYHRLVAEDTVRYRLVSSNIVRLCLIPSEIVEYRAVSSGTVLDALGDVRRYRTSRHPALLCGYRWGLRPAQLSASEGAYATGQHHGSVRGMLPQKAPRVGSRAL